MALKKIPFWIILVIIILIAIILIAVIGGLVNLDRELILISILVAAAILIIILIIILLKRKPDDKSLLEILDDGIISLQKARMPKDMRDDLDEKAVEQEVKRKGHVAVTTRVKSTEGEKKITFAIVKDKEDIIYGYAWDHLHREQVLSHDDMKVSTLAEGLRQLIVDYRDIFSPESIVFVKAPPKISISKKQSDAPGGQQQSGQQTGSEYQE